MNITMPSNTPTAVALIVVTALAGCALEPRRAEAPPEPRIVMQPAPPSEADQLLAYASRVRRLDARDLAVERDLARASIQKDKSELNRLKCALLLSLAGNTPAGDDAEIILLLEPFANLPAGTAAEPEIRVLSSLLLAQAQDRKKLREQLRDAQARLTFARRDETREAETRALRAQVEELEKKLSALKSIERSVNRRAESATK